MSIPPDRLGELRTLLQRLSDDALSPEESRRLNELLHGNPEACELYLDHLTLEAHLRTEFGSQRVGLESLPTFARSVSGLAGGANRIPALRRAFRFPAVRFAAAVLLGALVMLSSLLSLRSVRGPLAQVSNEDELRHRQSADSVATLLFADDCQWVEQAQLLEGQRLSAGALRLRRGLAVLRFDGGAAVVLQGPTDLELESRGSARLTSGRLTVRAPEEAAGFTVRTPASDVVDLGTEFSLVVERNGATELHVLEGKVSYGKPGAAEDLTELLGAGKAVRYDRAQTSAPRLVPVNSPRFADLLSQAKVAARDDLLAAYEGFGYPLGRLALAEALGGSGWAGPWRLSPGAKQPADEDLNIVAGQLKINWPVLGGRGTMLEATPDYQSRTRPLAEPVRLDVDGVYYVSVLVRWDAPLVATGQTMPAVRMVLRSSTNFNGDRVMFNLPVFLRPQIDLRSGAIFTSSQTVARNETQLWVGKIVARRQGEDEVFFRVYGEGETLDTIEPADWSVRSQGVQSDAQLDLLLLTKFGGSTCWWDEVRIGKSWRAVVPTTAPAKEPK
jgi:hypothetical protein